MVFDKNAVIEYFTTDAVEEDFSPKFTRPELLNHPNIPKPLHSLAPRTFMKAKEWDIIRREAYARNNYCCFACGVHHPYNLDKKRFVDKKLHAHESYNIDYEKKSMELVEIVALCPLCHDSIHSGRMNSLFDKGVLDEEDCWLIVSQRERVLKHEVDKAVVPCYCDDCWGKWKIVIDGKEYFSKWKNKQEWREHYDR